MQHPLAIKTENQLQKKWHQIFWPIQKQEVPKFSAMAVLMFLILFAQNLIRSVKDSLVVNLIGAEVLSFIKLFIEMPAGILFVITYTLLCNRMTTEKVFRIVLLFFLTFFCIFGFWLFPHRDLLHPHPNLINHYVTLYPHLKWFFIMWSKWTLVIFYMMGELWPLTVFTQLYWQFANKITTSREANRFYFFFNLFGQTNLLISGSLIIYCFNKSNFLQTSLSNYQGSIDFHVSTSMAMVMVLCLCILLLHFFIEKKIMHHQMHSQHPERQTLHLSLTKSLRMIIRSKYLGLIFLLMLSYSMTINLVEALWLYEVCLFYKKNPSNFIIYQGNILFWIGVVALICSFWGNGIIRKIGWAGSAYITPITTLVIGGCFFILVAAQNRCILPDMLFQMPTLGAIVALGGVHNIFAKGTKYCFFDVTKEMAYIPLDREMRTKGKAAVDILGTKIGKSAGSILQVICYTIYTNCKPDQLALFLMGIFVIICLIWITTVSLLSKQYNKIIR